MYYDLSVTSSLPKKTAKTATMPWSSQSNYGSLENGEEQEGKKNPPDEVSMMIAMFAAFLLWLIGVALFAMILVMILDEKFI